MVNEERSAEVITLRATISKGTSETVSLPPPYSARQRRKFINSQKAVMKPNAMRPVVTPRPYLIQEEGQNRFSDDRE